MKAAKFIVLAGGIFGLLAFFLPLASAEDGGTKISVSAFQVIKGIDKASDTIDNAATQPALATESGGELDKAAAADMNDTLSAVKGYVMMAFVPTVLLLLFGGLGVKKQSFGRGFGTGALVFGLAGLGIGLLLKAGLGEAGAVGIAVYLMVFGGLAGVVGGLAGLVRPERAVATT